MPRAAVAIVATLAACTTAAPPAPAPTTAPPVPSLPPSSPATPPVAETGAAPARVVPAAPRVPPVPTTGSGEPGGDGAADRDMWAALARCESGMTNLRGPRYYGFHSWLLSTWRAAGGTGRPDEHTYDEQVAVAKAWLARTSWSQWPSCSRRLGLR